MVRMKSRNKAAVWFHHVAATAALISLAGLGLAGLLPSCDELPLKLEAKRLVEEAAGGGGATSPWSIQTLDSSGDVGKWASIALYGNEPRVAYYRVDFDVLFLKRTAGVWASPDLAYNGASFGTYISLAVDSADRPDISHVGGAGDFLIWTYYSAGSWNHTTMADEGSSSTFHDTAIASGVASPLFAYVAKPTTTIEAKFVSIPLSQYPIDGSNIAYCIDIARDDNDAANILIGKTNGLSYYKKSGVSWSGETIISSGPYVADCSLALTSGASPLLMAAFIDGNLHALNYAQSSNGTTWTVKELARDAGGQCSIALGTAGAPCIVYYDTALTALKFAYMDSDLVWHFEIVDGDGAIDVGSYCSIAVDGDARIHIAYYDATNGDLKYATRSKPW